MSDATRLSKRLRTAHTKAKLRGERCTVCIVDEHCTTMTCGRCGALNRNVGDDKVFKCPRCAVTIPRDWNAARNIFLRFLVTSIWLQPQPDLSLGSLGASREGTHSC